MSTHLLNALQKLELDILGLAAVAEEQLEGAVNALINRDPDAAREIVARDDEIDRREVDIEEECLKVLALHQPVAHDLRFVISALKMTNNLERIGDYAASIAERTITLSENPDIEPLLDFASMSAKVLAMLRKSIRALIEQDSKLARQVWSADDEIDALHRKCYVLVEERIRARSSDVRYLLQFISVSRCLERVADLATNIADDVVYMVDGQISHHKRIS